MICPLCRHDNIEGVDACAACGQPLAVFEEQGGELEKSIARHPVSVLAPKEPVFVGPKATVREAIAEMLTRRIGCLLVIDAGKLVGIFTDRDVLSRVSPDLSALDRPVTEFATAATATIQKQDSIAYALQSMSLGGYRHLPIVDKAGKPVGIISIRDILRFLCVRFAEIRSRVS